MNNSGTHFLEAFIAKSSFRIVFSGTAIFINDWSRMTQVENVCLEASMVAEIDTGNRGGSQFFGV